MYYWFQQRGRVMTNEYLVKGYLFWDSLTRNRSDGALVRLTVPMPEGAVEEQADRQLAQFAARTRAGAAKATCHAEPGSTKQMDLLLAFILAMALTMALIPLLMRRAGAMHVLDAPAERKVHERPMPRVGGIAMAVGVAVPLLLWLRLRPAHRGLRWSSALIVLLFGVWDDRATLSPGIKFLGQLIAVRIVVLVGGVEIHSLTFAARVELPAIVAAPLTVLFLLGVTNAINLSDGLDGLAGGTTFLCCAAIALLGFGTDLAFVSTVAVVVMGSLLGFLRYNSFPARVFMGDGGSQFLGFTVGVLAVLLTQNEALPFSAALPLLLLGLPILDTLTVIAIRLRERRSPFSADKNHLHHRLLGLGFEHFEAVGVIYLLQGALFLLAWQLRFQLRRRHRRGVPAGSRRRCCWRCSWPSVAAGAGAASASSGWRRAGWGRGCSC